MKTRRSIIIYLCFILFVSCFIASNLAVKESRKNLGVRYSFQINPLSPEVITLFAGEFKGLMADYLLLEIGSFIGSNRKISQDQWGKICLGFRQAQRLDPYFQQTYLLVQGVLAWCAKKPDTTVKILDVSRKHRPWDWRPGYYMGFDYYYFLNDYEKASEIFLETAKIKNAPLLIALLGSRFAVKSKRTEMSLQILNYMLKEPELQNTYKKELKDRIIALKGVLLLEKAISNYKKKNNAYPSSLEVLIEQKYIRKLPVNPYNQSFKYKNGQVEF